MARSKKINRDELNDLYESKMKSFIVNDPETGKQYPLPVCYGRRETHVRKPVKPSDMDASISKVAECPRCTFVDSCSSATAIDIADQTLMFNRMINGKQDTLLNLLRQLLPIRPPPDSSIVLREARAK